MRTNTIITTTRDRKTSNFSRRCARWGANRPRSSFANLLTAMLCSPRGTVCIDQGEELGLTEADIPFDALHDPCRIAFWPRFRGRDGCRTPMPWNTGVPWLPVPPEHLDLAVSRQEVNPASMLQGFRTFMRWRHQHPVLRDGAIRFLDTPEPILAFVRESDDERMLMVFNLSPAPARLTLPDLGTPRPLCGHGLRAGSLAGNVVDLPGDGALFAALAPGRDPANPRPVDAVTTP